MQAQGRWRRGKILPPQAPRPFPQWDRQLLGLGVWSLTLAHQLETPFLANALASPSVPLSAGEGNSGLCHAGQVKLSVRGEEAYWEFQADTREALAETGFFLVLGWEKW